MTLVLDLPPELETRLNEAAQNQGLDLATYAVKLLETGVTDGLSTIGQEILAQWDTEGVLGSWAGRLDIGDSAAFARTLRAEAESRQDH